MSKASKKEEQKGINSPFPLNTRENKEGRPAKPQDSQFIQQATTEQAAEQVFSALLYNKGKGRFVDIKNISSLYNKAEDLFSKGYSLLLREGKITKEGQGLNIIFKIKASK